jgi:AraC-like DNA-binding protein
VPPVRRNPVPPLNTQRIKSPHVPRAARAGHGDRVKSVARNHPAIPDVTDAGDGKVWSQAAQKLNPDLIVSEGMNPREYGHGSGKKPAEEPEATRLLVVLLTVRNPTEYRIEGILSGAENYIPTEPDLNQLKARIKHLIESGQGLKDECARHQVLADTEWTVAPSDGHIVTKAIKVVEEHMIDEDFSVDRFSQLMGMSRSTLKRKLKALTGLSPQPFVQQLRLQRAARLLGAGGITISETARLVGFYDLSHFGRVFKSHWSCTPSQYAKKRPARPTAHEPAAKESLNPWPAHIFGPNLNVFGLCL